MIPTSSELQREEHGYWIFLGQINTEVMEEDIENHLELMGIPHSSITCEILYERTHEKAYKIGIPTAYEREAYNPENWPHGIIVKPFRFNRRPRGRYPLNRFRFR